MEPKIQPAEWSPIPAARGNALSCRGWPQEAALRLLINGCDPDVNDQPLRLDGAARDAILRALRVLDDDQTLLVLPDQQPLSVLQTEKSAPRVFVGDVSLAKGWVGVGTARFLHSADLILSAAAQSRFAGSLAGKFVVSCGMGTAEGALALAASCRSGAFLGIDPDGECIKRRVKAGYVDVLVNHLDEALRILKNAVRKREAASVGLIGECAQVLGAMATRGIVPDLLVSQSEPTPEGRQLETLGSAFLEFPAAPPSAITEGRSPLLWVALSGEASDMRRLDQLLLDHLPSSSAAEWIRIVRQRAIRFEGLPARVCWLARDDAVRFCNGVNELLARDELKAPIALGCDVFRVTAEWPLSNALEDIFAGAALLAPSASFASLPGPSTAAVFVADGTPEAGARMERGISATHHFARLDQ